VCEPLLDGHERDYVLDCLDTSWISSSGKYIGAFEEAFARYCGAAHGVACSNGSTAIHLALAAMEIGPGDEVIVPCFNLIVATNAVILTGAKPVLVDVDPRTWCIDPALVEEKVTPRTRAIIAVHMYGHPCDMDPLLAIAARHGLKVIEDGAEAHGAEYKGRRVGGLADAACFSFYGNKIITTGEGGMVTTNDAALAERMALLRSQAFEEPRFVHRYIGFNYRMTNVQAAMGLAQVERIDHKVARKRELAGWYSSMLAADPEITLPVEEPWALNVFWMYGVVLHDGFGLSRDELMRALAAQGVETRAFFYPMHQQPVYRNGSDPRFPDVSGSYPVSERLGRAGLYLPSGVTLTHEQAEQVVAALRASRAAAPSV
jgi:perosamine synthetase